jgi:hypothetical protein
MLSCWFIISIKAPVLKERTLPAGFIAPCLPTKAQTPPSGGLWLHEIKHDGFRVIARKKWRAGEALQPTCSGCTSRPRSRTYRDTTAPACAGCWMAAR